METSTQQKPLANIESLIKELDQITRPFIDPDRRPFYSIKQLLPFVSEAVRKAYLDSQGPEQDNLDSVTKQFDRKDIAAQVAIVSKFPQLESQMPELLHTLILDPSESGIGIPLTNNPGARHIKSLLRKAYSLGLQLKVMGGANFGCFNYSHEQGWKPWESRTSKGFLQDGFFFQLQNRVSALAEAVDLGGPLSEELRKSLMAVSKTYTLVSSHYLRALRLYCMNSLELSFSIQEMYLDYLIGNKFDAFKRSSQFMPSVAHGFKCEIEWQKEQRNREFKKWHELCNDMLDKLINGGNKAVFDVLAVTNMQPHTSLNQSLFPQGVQSQGDSMSPIDYSPTAMGTEVVKWALKIMNQTDIFVSKLITDIEQTKYQRPQYV